MKTYLHRLTCRLFGHTVPDSFNWTRGTPNCELVNRGWGDNHQQLSIVKLSCPRCGAPIVAGFLNQWRAIDPARGYPEVYRLAKFAGSSGAGGNARDRRAFRRRMVRAASSLIHRVTG